MWGDEYRARLKKTPREWELREREEGSREEAGG
jgi:hypothetical protein